MKTFYLFFLMVFSFTLLAGEEIKVEKVRIKFVPKQSPNSAMFAQIKNTSAKDVALVKAESDISKTVELHDMIMADKEMKMRPVDKFVVKANSTLELKPGSFHVMFIGLKEGLKLGEKKKVTLTFDNGEKVTLDVPVEKIMVDSNMMPHKHH